MKRQFSIAVLAFFLAAAAHAAEDPLAATYHAGDLDGCKSACEKRIAKNNYDGNAHYYLGLCLAKKRNVVGATEQFKWILLNSADPELRAASDKSLAALAAAAREPVARPAQSSATSNRTGDASPTRTGDAMRRPEAAAANTPAGTRVGHEFTPAERAIEQTRAKIIQQKTDAMHSAQQECLQIDLATNTQLQRLYRERSYDGMRRAALLRDDADRRKRAIMTAAKQRMAAWDDALSDLATELAHPGKSIQLVPQNVNPYVKNFMNTGESDEPQPQEIVPLRAVPQKYKKP